MKRIAALAVAAAFAVGFAGPTASADHCGAQGPSSGGTEVENPATGGYVYADGDESGSGFVGITGDSGYLEVSGDLTAGSVQVHGSQPDTGVHGNVGTDAQCLPEA